MQLFYWCLVGRSRTVWPGSGAIKHCGVGFINAHACISVGDEHIERVRASVGRRATQ